MYKLLFSALLCCLGTVLFAQDDPALKSGMAKQKEGKHDLAVTEFTNVIQKYDAEVQTFVKKWDEYSKISVFERAEKGIEAPPIEVSYAKAYYLRGVSYAALRRNDEALNDFTIATKVNPKLAAAFYERGRIYWLQDKKFEGCCDLGTARALGDSLAQVLFDEKFCWNEAVIYYKDAISKLKLNQYEGALELIQKSVDICPDSATYIAVRGKCYGGMGKLDLAFNDFSKALKLSPNNKEAFFGRGLANYQKRDFQAAFDDLDQAIQMDAKLIDAYLYRAYACEGMGKVQSALYDYQQVQKLRPYDPLAFYKSGLLKNENGDPKGACVDFKKAAAMGHQEAADYAKSCK